jgi:putative transcriptional regulator
MPKAGGWPESGFGKRLRELREARGLTQEQLAGGAECSRFTVLKVESGSQEPAWPLAVAFARALGVSVADFLPDGPTTRPAPKPSGQKAAPNKGRGRK